MKYRVYFKNGTYELIKATGYNANDSEFVTFWISIPGLDFTNVASYKSKDIKKIICEDLIDKNQLRTNKLKRIVKNKWWKKILNK